MSPITTGEALFIALSTTMVLAINWRALASHRLPPQRIVAMALIWTAIIAAVAMAFAWFQQ